MKTSLTLFHFSKMSGWFYCRYSKASIEWVTKLILPNLERSILRTEKARELYSSGRKKCRYRRSELWCTRTNGGAGVLSFPRNGERRPLEEKFGGAVKPLVSSWFRISREQKMARRLLKAFISWLLPFLFFRNLIEWQQTRSYRRGLSSFLMDLLQKQWRPL